MKSRQDRKKYNKFIRPNHKRYQSNCVYKEHRLEHFEDWNPKLVKRTSLVNIRGILENVSLNSERGIQKMLKKQGTQKLVLVNHQRKPINYYLSGNKTPGPSSN